MIRLASLLFIASGLIGCASNDTTSDGRDDSFTTDGKLDGFSCTPQEAVAILDVVNTASRATLENDVQLAEKAIDNILAYRAGDDEDAGTSDDETFATLGELDAIPYIGPTAFQKLLDYVHDADLVPDQAPRAWLPTATIANGSIYDVAVAKNGKAAAVFWSSGAKVALPTGTTVDLPLPANTSHLNWARIAVDSANNVHVLYTFSSSDSSTKHVSYKNGQWTQHDPLAIEGDELVQFDNGPNGEMFAVAGGLTYGGGYPLSLFKIEANGTALREPLWKSDGPEFHLNVDRDGFANLAWDATTVRSGRRTNGGWQTRDTGYQYSTNSFPTMATSGGADALVIVEPADWLQELQMFRVQGGSVATLAPFEHPAKAVHSDATLEADGTAHACIVEAGNVMHLMLDSTGAVQKQMVGIGTRCSIDTDASGKVHATYVDGAIASHAVLE